MSFLKHKMEQHITETADGEYTFGRENVFTETTSDRVVKKENGDKYVDIGLHGEKPYGIHELQYAVTQNPFLGSDYHIERGEEIAFAKNLNKYVDVNDHFIFLGDFDSRHSTPDFDRLKRFFANIKCRNVYLILGNNDSFPVKKYKELGIKAVVDKFEFGNCILTHFPVMVKAPMINIHGHLHGAASPTQKGEKAYWYADPKRCVDVWRDDFSPVRLNDVLANWKEMKKYKSYSDGKMRLLSEDKDGDEHMYFYHLVPKGSDVSGGIKSLDWFYKHDKKLFLKYSEKYRDRLVNAWGIYSNTSPEKLTAKMIYDGINKFRGTKDGCNQIYCFYYPPHRYLGEKMRKLLETKDIYRIDIKSNELKNCLKSIDWGYEGSFTGNKKLNENWYKKCTYDDYFSKYDENVTPLFSTLNHISICTKDGVIPEKCLIKIENPEMVLTTESGDDVFEESMSEDITTIIFDFGGVLIDSHAKEKFKALNLPEEDVFEITETLNTINSDIEYIPYKDALSKFYKSLSDEFKKKYSFKKIQEIFNIQMDCKVPSAYADSLLKGLKKKGYRLLYLTNRKKCAQELIDKQGLLKFVKYFEGGIVSGDVGMRKPNPEIWKMLIKKYSLNPEECLFVDDKEKNCLVAKSLGMQYLVFDRKRSLVTLRSMQNIRKVGLTKELLGLNRKMNYWDYGAIVNGKKIILDRDFLYRVIQHNLNEIEIFPWDKYKTTPVEKIEKNQIGVCLDYVNYQHYWFDKKKIPNESYYYVQELSDVEDDNVIHTFSIISIGNKKYWFESAWKEQAGIHKVSSWQDVFKELRKRHDPEMKFPYIIGKYDPAGLDKNLSISDFLKKINIDILSQQRRTKPYALYEPDTDNEIVESVNENQFQFIDFKNPKAKSYLEEGEKSYWNKFGDWHIKNSGNPAVKVARDAVAKWERNNGYNDKEDWSDNLDDTSDYMLKEESSDEVLTENVMISRNDIYYGFDKFESGEKNVLLITGFSGSGKSTLAENLSSKYDCDYFMIDSLEFYAGGYMSLDNLKKGEPGCYEFLMKHPKFKETLERDYSEKEYWNILCQYIPWLISWCKKKKPEKFIIEGLQLYETLSEGSVPDTILSNPFIIKGTSGLKSAWRAGKRAGGKELPVEFVRQLKWAFKDNKQLEQLKKALDKEYGESSDEILSGEVVTEEANYNKRNIYPVYIILTDADSPMAKLIKSYTGQPYAHALISFNTDLEPAYSFGCTSIKPLKFGFISKSEEDPFRNEEKAAYVVYVMYVNKMQYTKIQDKLQWFMDNKDKMKYSWGGLLTLGLHIPKQFENQYFCSQFVMDLIGDAIKLPKDPSLWTPGDIEHLQNISLVDKGPDLRYFNKKRFKRNLKYIQKHQFNKMKYESVDLFSEATDSITNPNLSHYFVEKVGKRVDKVLSDPAKVKEFNNLVRNYINRNITKLTKSGPCDMIPFTDLDHKQFQEMFGFWYNITKTKETSPNEIREYITEYSKLAHAKITFWLNNSSQVLFYFVIRYFTMHPDPKSLNAALSIYTLCIYPVMFHKYFPLGVMEPIMQYTIDNLTEKFLIKKSKHLFDSLLQSIQASYRFHKNNFKNASDKNVADWISRIRNDQNSMLKKISNEYMKNWKDGKAARTTNEEYDSDTPIIDELENGTTAVQNIVQKVTLPIIEEGVDLVRAEAAAKMAQVSISDCRYFLTLIITDSNADLIQKFIESILFLYIYEGKKTERDIRSTYFITWAASLFKKTNSKNPNINTINDILNTWSENSGINKKFSRIASRINYKKAIFYYLILCIQKHV